MHLPFIQAVLRLWILDCTTTGLVDDQALVGVGLQVLIIRQKAEDLQWEAIPQ